MKWVLFTGTWRLADKAVEADVRSSVREVFGRGDAIVTGGATGVDYYAMDEAVKLEPSCKRLRIILPTTIEGYILDSRNNWCQAPVTALDIDLLEALLNKIKEVNPASMLEMPHSNITQEHYYHRDTEEVKYADSVYAFQVNNSKGTQDTIDKAKAAGLPITLHKKYTI